MKYQDRKKLWNEDYRRIPWYIRSKRGTMKTFGLVIAVCLVSSAALISSILLTSEITEASMDEVKNLQERVAKIEEDVEFVNQFMWQL